MTEAEWLACDDPERLLAAVKGETDLRKWRLLGVALVRSDLPWHHLGGRTLTEEDWESTRPVLEAIEARADAGREEVTWELDPDFQHAPDVSEMLHGGSLDEQAIEARLIRDVFGNPFRTVVLKPAWRTSDVLTLARGIYDERAFDRLPILADAIQDAGCDSAELLNHLREPGEHVRGCWALDLVLGKG